MLTWWRGSWKLRDTSFVLWSLCIHPKFERWMKIRHFTKDILQIAFHNMSDSFFFNINLVYLLTWITFSHLRWSQITSVSDITITNITSIDTSALGETSNVGLITVTHTVFQFCVLPLPNIVVRVCLCWQIQYLAIRCIQKNIKKNRGVKFWPWWKLFTTVRPLIEVQLTEEQIRGKDVRIPIHITHHWPYIFPCSLPYHLPQSQCPPQP